MIAFTEVPKISDESDSEGGNAFMIIKYICLVLNPVLVAYGSVMMRQMRKLDENVVSCYMNGFAIPVMVGLCYLTGGDLSAWRDFAGL